MHFGEGIVRFAVVLQMMLLFASGSFTLVVIYSSIRKLKSILLFGDTILIRPCITTC